MHTCAPADLGIQDSEDGKRAFEQLLDVPGGNCLSEESTAEQLDKEDNSPFRNLPYDIVRQIAISSVVSSQPLKIVSIPQEVDGFIWKIANRNDFDLAFMYTNKHFSKLCQRTFLMQNTWSFTAWDIAPPYTDQHIMSYFIDDLTTSQRNLIHHCMIERAVSRPYEIRFDGLMGPARRLPNIRTMTMHTTKEQLPSDSEGNEGPAPAKRQGLHLRWMKGVDEVIFTGELPSRVAVGPELRPEPNACVWITGMDRVGLIRGI